MPSNKIREIYNTEVEQLALSVVQTAIASVRVKNINRTGLRLYQNKKIAVAGGIGKVDHQNLEKTALETLNTAGIDYPFPISENNQRTVELSNDDLDYSAFVNQNIEMLKRLNKQIKDFSFGGSLKMTNVGINLSNDRGLDLNYRDYHYNFGLTFKEKTSANIIDGFAGYHSRKFDSGLFEQQIKEICQAYRNKLPSLSPGKYPVIFPADGRNILNKLAVDLNGQKFAAGASLLSGKLGQQLFSEKFSLYQSSDPLSSITPFFDAEGIVNPDYCYGLIDSGVLNAPYTDKRTAFTYQQALTGSAASSYDGVPTLSCPELEVKPTADNLKDLLGADPGIYIYISEGGDFTSDGRYATPVQLAFLCDGNSFIGRLPEFNLSSEVFSMYGSDFRGASKQPLFPLGNSGELVIEMEIS